MTELPIWVLGAGGQARETRDLISAVGCDGAGRALAFQSRLIIMDEPTAPLTGKDAEGLFRTIRTLRDRGVSDGRFRSG